MSLFLFCLFVVYSLLKLFFGLDSAFLSSLTSLLINCYWLLKICLGKPFNIQKHTQVLLVLQHCMTIFFKTYHISYFTHFIWIFSVCFPYNCEFHEGKDNLICFLNPNVRNYSVKVYKLGKNKAITVPLIKNIQVF